MIFFVCVSFLFFGEWLCVLMVHLVTNHYPKNWASVVAVKENVVLNVTPSLEIQHQWLCWGLSSLFIPELKTAPQN